MLSRISFRCVADGVFFFRRFVRYRINYCITYRSLLIRFYLFRFYEPFGNSTCGKTRYCIVFYAILFFGIGLVFVREVQLLRPSLFRQVMSYLYGQAATLTDIYLYIFGIFSILLSVIIILFLKEIRIMTFDRSYAKSIGVPVKGLDAVFSILTVIAVIIGIRAVGVVLMSAMLIAPPIAARQFTNRLSVVFILAGLIGIFSGFMGNYLSVALTNYFQDIDHNFRIIFPTGPMIVIFASTIALLSLLVAPKRGLIFKLRRAPCKEGPDASSC